MQRAYSNRANRSARLWQEADRGEQVGQLARAAPAGKWRAYPNLRKRPAKPNLGVAPGVSRAAGGSHLGRAGPLARPILESDARLKPTRIAAQVVASDAF